MKRRLMSIVSAAAVAVTMTAGTAYLPMVGEITSITASAETSGDYEYTILDDGTAEITKYKGTDEVLEIPSEIDGYKVTSIGEFSFYGCKTLKSITIPDGVTRLCKYAFSVCSALNSITIPDGVTYIGSDAFWQCTSLTSITIPDSVTSMGTYVFNKCKSLTSVTLSNGLNGISEGTFYECTSLASITIPNSVTSIYAYAFVDCTSLETIDLSNRLKNIDKMAFRNCTSLSSVTIPKSVVLIGDNAFGYKGFNKTDKIDDFKIYCYSGTAGEKYAINNRFEYELIDDVKQNPTITYQKGDNSVNLTWTAVDNAEKYAVYGYVNSTWQKFAECSGTSYTVKNLKAGTDYKVAVIAMIDGEWNTDFSNAIVVSPNPIQFSAYPDVTSVEYSEEFHQFRLKWKRVQNAEQYGIAVKLSGKWKVKNTVDSNTTTYTSPKLTPGMTYEMVICAKVNGEWDTSKLSHRIITVVVK